MNRPLRLIALLLIALLLPALQSRAAVAKTWEVKVRAAYAQMADQSDAFTALDIFFPADSITVESKWLPEIDVVYAFTANWQLEVVLTIPQTHDVTLRGVGNIGSFQELPPTFSIIYEFVNKTHFQPYVSAGVNVTWITDSDLSVAGVDLDLDTFSVGPALGVGCKYDINDRWDIDGSIKWIGLNSDVKAGEITLTNAQLDPFLYSLGVAYRF